MKIGLPKEIKEQEYRVAIIPSNVAKLVDAGHEVFVEKGAGAAAGFPDEEYIAAGAEIVESEKACFEKAEMITKVKEILPQEFGLLREDQILFTYIHSANRRPQTDELMKSKDPDTLVIPGTVRSPAVAGITARDDLGEDNIQGMGHGDSQTENAFHNRLVLFSGNPFGRQKDIEIEGRKPLVSGRIDLQVRNQL